MMRGQNRTQPTSFTVPSWLGDPAHATRWLADPRSTWTEPVEAEWRLHDEGPWKDKEKHYLKNRRERK